MQLRTMQSSSNHITLHDSIKSFNILRVHDSFDYYKHTINTVDEKVILNF